MNQRIPRGQINGISRKVRLDDLGGGEPDVLGDDHGTALAESNLG